MRCSLISQTLPQKRLTDEEFVARIQQRLKDVDNLRDIDDAAKAKLREQYEQSQLEMESAKTWAGKQTFSEKELKDAPAELNRVKAELAKLQSKPASLVPENLDQAITKLEADLEQQRRCLKNWMLATRRRTARRIEIPNLTTACAIGLPK